LKQSSVLDISNLSLSADGQLLLDDVSFSLHTDQVLGIIGESGSGKSLTALSILKLLQHNIKASGSILYDNNNILYSSESEMRKIRGNDVSIIFQDPQSSLNPLLTVGEQISETIYFNQGLSWKNSKEYAIELLSQVEIPQPSLRYSDYPHRFSGGMLQRVMIAIAISSHPKILIADEATTALDRIVERNIIELLLRFKKRYKFSLMLISHDLRIVEQYSDRIIVYKEGKIIEEGDVQKIVKNPSHPYTKRLFEISRIMNKKNTRNELNFNSGNTCD